MTGVKNPRLALIFILITVFIDILGLGIIVPVLPGLLEELTAERVSSAAAYGGFLISAYALMQFIFSPILGNLSDRYGRRPVLLASLLGLTLDYLLMGFAPTIIWLFIGRIVAGIMGAAISTATAYIADITPKEKRAQSFGLIGAAVGAGFIIGPAIGGQLGEFGTRVPFFVAAAVAFINLVYGYFILPESLGKRKRRRFDAKRANPIGTIQSLKKFPFVISFLGVLFFFSLAGQAYPSIWSFFTIERFQWTPAQIGISLSVFGIMFAVVQGALMRPAIKLFGELWTVVAGLAFATIGFFGMAFIDTAVGLYIFLLPGALGGFVGPGLNGLMSSRVDDNAQGELQGGVNAVNSITAILGPLAATQLFAFFTLSPDSHGYFPGVAFFASGIAIVVGAIIFLQATWRSGLMSHRPKSDSRTDQEG
ncbi:TCR/Tet family MFS transporter [Maritalea sp.]|jgi:DHA1 family tetracycline resistance protein-like MFS transporter|uniref:TCR/Tet family MFS transporter n=1 Tax=Maritalea sp. TaxID=2003361 RepID=UPI0039E7016D